MRKEIETKLLRLKIEGREIHKEKARNILIIIVLAAVFYLIPHFYSQLSQLLALDALIILFGGMYIVMDGIPTLGRPLREEYRAFQKVVDAIQILEKSNEPIAYEEAYRCLRHAYKILDVKMSELGEFPLWYNKMKEILEQYHENLELIVLPAIFDSNIEIEHLEEIALAVQSPDLQKMKAINKTLESSYRKHPKPPRKVRIFARKFRESTIGQVLSSLALGYGLIIVICFIYVSATEQDFMVLLKERPEIVILGGLGISGITFWKTK